MVTHKLSCYVENVLQIVSLLFLSTFFCFVVVETWGLMNCNLNTCHIDFQLMFLMMFSSLFKHTIFLRADEWIFKTMQISYWWMSCELVLMFGISHQSTRPSVVQQNQYHNFAIRLVVLWLIPRCSTAAWNEAVGSFLVLLVEVKIFVTLVRSLLHLHNLHWHCLLLRQSY